MMAGVQKPKIHWAISLFLVMLYFSGLTAQAQYGGGSGTAGYPYLIYTAEQMNAIGANPNDRDKHFKLMADIDLGGYTGTSFNIIGYWVNPNDNKPFTTVFDGNGKRISNFSYTSTERSYVGIFGYVSTFGKVAVIKNLGLIDPNVDAGTRGNIGSLVGSLEEGTITNCYVEGGSVSGDWGVGGLVGYKRYYSVVAACFWDIQTSGFARTSWGIGMTTASTFLDAGWDFVDETENGTEDIWWILEGKDYPRLWWELTTDEPSQ